MDLLYENSISPLYFSIISSILTYLLYYYYCAVKVPIIGCSHKFKHFLEENLPIVNEKFWPTIWCIEPRLQSMLGYFWNFRLPHSYERVLLTLDDGGEVVLDWMHPGASNNYNEFPEDTPILIILPGLGAHSEMRYVKTFAVSAKEMGYRSVVFNYRGQGGIPLKTPKPFSTFINVRDMEFVIQHVKDRYPSALIGAVGVSLGSMVIGLYLNNHTQDEKQKINAAMFVSLPYDIIKGTENIERGIDLILNRALTDKMKSVFKDNYSIFKNDNKEWNLDKIMKTNTLRKFDTEITIKYEGYEDVFAYYRDISLLSKLGNIKIPVLCLSALDDPLQPLSASEISELFNFKNVAILATTKGGHIGFLDGLWPINKGDPCNGYTYRVYIQYFTTMFTNQNHLRNFQ